MRTVLRSFGIIVSLIAIANTCFSQQYPVAVTLQTSPVYQLTWNALSHPLSNPIQVILIHNDLGSPAITVRLHFQLEGPGFQLENRNDVNLQGFPLQPGIPTFLSGAQLADYFMPSKWKVIQGNFPQTQFPLPEGGYTLKVIAKLYQSGQQTQISNESTFWFALQNADAPQLLFPVCQSNVDLLPGTPILFQWTSPMISDIIIQQRLHYSFQLFQVNGTINDANQIANSSTPLLQFNLTENFLHYHLQYPPLIPGWKYVWRVRSFDPLQQVAFVNNGYSNACMFTYGEDPRPGIQLTISAITARNAMLQWTNFPGSTQYEIRLREENTQQWYSVQAAGNSYTWQQLQPGERYEAQVRSTTVFNQSDWSNPVFFTTAQLPHFSCGQSDLPFRPQQFSPASVLNPGDMVSVGQFEMQVIEAWPLLQEGYFRGKGKISMYGLLPLSVKFNRIYVDESRNLREGIVEAESDGLGTWYANQTVGTVSAGNETAEHIITTVIDTISISPGNQIIINGNDIGIVLDTSAGTTIEDGSGALYIITENGTIIHAGQSGSGSGVCPDSENILIPGLASIRFEHHPEEKYGLDIFQHTILSEYYLEVRIHGAGTTRKVDWKSIRSSKYDHLAVQIEIINPSVHPDSIRFQTWAGTRYNFTRESNRYQLSVVGGTHGDGQELFIWVKDQNEWKKAGKLNIVHYDISEKSLCLVQINTTSIETDIVKKVSQQGVVNWHITTKNWELPQGWDLNSDGKLQTDGYAYSDEMEVIVDALKGEEWFDPKIHYLLLLPMISSEDDLAGEMRRGKKIGFIFPSSNRERTIAHEIGHGAFGWEHTFSGRTPVPKGSTENIMDYGAGNSTFKFQWDLIHDPALLPGIGDDEGDIALLANGSLGEFENVVGKDYAFPAPSGALVKIPGARMVRFNKDGALTRFIHSNGKTYTGIKNSHDYFIGYYDTSLVKQLEGVLTREKNTLLNQSNFRDFSFAPHGSVVFSKSATLHEQIMVDCYCERTWTSTSISTSLKGEIVLVRPPETAIALACTGTQCYDPFHEGVHEGIGMKLYYFLRPKLPSSTDFRLLAELCNHISETANGKVFAFYGNQLEGYYPQTVLSYSIAQKFIELRIFTLNAFLQKFPYQNYSRDVEVIYSNVDLRDRIPSDYNINTKDYHAQRNGFNRKYEYSYSDLCSRHKMIGTSYIDLIYTNERNGMAEPLSESDFYEQYVGLYGTNSAFPFIAMWASRWAKDVLSALMLKRFAPEMFGALMTYYGEQFLINIALGSTIDFLVLFGFEYFFAEEDISLGEALDKVNMSEALKEGIVDGFCGKMHSMIGHLMGALGDCLIAGADGNVFKEGFDCARCSEAAMGYLLGGAAGRSIFVGHRIFKKLKELSPERLERGLWKIGIRARESIDAVLEWLGKRATRVIARGVHKNDFLNSVAEFANGHMKQVADEAWEHFYNEDWRKLEDLFIRHNINGKWPPYGGFISSQKITLKVGDTFDRYGGREINGVFDDATGFFCSPIGTNFESRALPISYKIGPDKKPYKKYKVIKEISDVQIGEAIPWFEMPGKGTQYKNPKSINQLIAERYIEEIN